MSKYYRGLYAWYEIYLSAADTWCILADNGNYNGLKTFLGFDAFEEAYNYIVDALENGNIPEELEDSEE